jgi:hypothetical protein
MTTSLTGQSSFNPCQGFLAKAQGATTSTCGGKDDAPIFRTKFSGRVHPDFPVLLALSLTDAKVMTAR